MNIVHIEGDHMNTIVTSKEDILKNSRELIREKGWAAVSIRSVASACGVSVGSIYNYYDSKAELISATVERLVRNFPPPAGRGCISGCADLCQMDVRAHGLRL
jgi:hypothetical protein